MFSEKGKMLLVVNQFKFSQAHIAKDGKIRWRCIKRECSAKVYTQVSDKTNSVVCGDIVHNHDVDSTLSRQMFSNSVKRGAAENPSEKPSKIICRQLHQDQYKNLTLTTTDMACVRKNMYEERRSVYPTIPKTQEDVITTVKSMELTTNKGENFLLLASEVNRIIIFSCFTNLYFLCQVDNIYVDGTFQYCSKFF
jgi:hypothetical protein